MWQQIASTVRSAPCDWPDLRPGNETILDAERLTVGIILFVPNVRSSLIEQMIVIKR
jgi:hypothetical protein